MTRNAREEELFRVIARQALSRDHAQWLAENISEGLDWPSVTQRAFNEGLSPLFYYHFRHLNLLEAIPESTKKCFARIYAETSLINRLFLREMDELEKELEKQHIQVIVLKGAALLKTVYHDVALRPMEDIDLMVRQGDRDSLETVLEKMGFVRNRLYPVSFRKGILSMDIHSDFLSSHRIRSRQEILDIRLADSWGSAIPINGSASLYRLCHRNEMIELCFHLLKHRYDRFIWFVDIAENLKVYRSMSDWHDLVAYSQHILADRLLLYTLLLAKRFVGADVPEEVLTMLGKEELSAIEKFLLRLKLMHAPMGMLTSLLWMSQIRGTGKKIRFIRENIFPRREVLSQIFPDSSLLISALLRRSILVSSHLLFDILMSVRFAFKGNLPRL